AGRRVALEYRLCCHAGHGTTSSRPIRRMRRELSTWLRRGVPGEIATPMTGQEDENPRDAERPGVPLGRPGDAREVASVIAFLACELSSFVPGASLLVDGGMVQMGPQAGSHIESNEWRSPNKQ